MTKFAIAGLQLALPNADNREQIAKEVEITLRQFPWVQMIVLPELSAYGYDLSHAQELNGEAETFFCDLATRHKVWLVPGSLYERRGGKIFNMAPVIDPSGAIVARYRKIYPFRPYEAGVESGLEIVVFDVPEVGRFGISICYDSWFPETTRAMVFQGAEVIIHPTMIPTIDRPQDLVVTQANAIINQCYFVDINNAGDLGNGQSIIVGPEGDVIHQAREQRSIMPVTLDLDRVREARVRGHKNLGQVLKSFRDTQMHYACYGGATQSSSYLASLGPLEVPRRADDVSGDTKIK